MVLKHGFLWQFLMVFNLFITYVFFIQMIVEMRIAYIAKVYNFLKRG